MFDIDKSRLQNEIKKVPLRTGEGLRIGKNLK
jgi:hypothetical protein